MGAILSILPMISSALDVIGKFKGSATLAKTTGYVQDAVSVVGALAPLVTQWGGGKEVTEDDVRVALAGMDSALAEFDKRIAEAEAAGRA